MNAMNGGMMGGMNPGMNAGMMGGMNGAMNPGMMGGMNAGMNPGMNPGMMGGMNGVLANRVNPGMMAGGLNPPVVAAGGAGFIGQPQFAGVSVSGCHVITALMTLFENVFQIGKEVF